MLTPGYGGSHRPTGRKVRVKGGPRGMGRNAHPHPCRQPPRRSTLHVHGEARAITPAGALSIRSLTAVFPREAAVAAGDSVGPGPTLLKAISAVLMLLVLAAIGYAFWIIIRYWEHTGV